MAATAKATRGALEVLHFDLSLSRLLIVLLVLALVFESACRAGKGYWRYARVCILILLRMLIRRSYNPRLTDLTFVPAAAVGFYSYTHTLIHGYTGTRVPLIHGYTGTRAHAYTHTPIRSYTHTLLL